MRFIGTSSPILDDRGVLRGVLVSFHDVTELDRVNSQLREAITELESSRTQVLHQNQELEKANDMLHIEIDQRKRCRRMRLQVTDTAGGIKREHPPRLFSQGFTTRKVGQGLGLHSSAITAKNLGGTIQAHSAGEGEGATFTLDLPLTLAEVAA